MGTLIETIVALPLLNIEVRVHRALLQPLVIALLLLDLLAHVRRKLSSLATNVPSIRLIEVLP